MSIAFWKSKGVKRWRSSRAIGRHLWAREDELINHRLTWLGVTQALLFTAVGFAIQFQNSTDCDGEGPLVFLARNIPWLGVATSALILLGVAAATLAMYYVHRDYKLEHFGVSCLTTALGWTCALGLPAVFVAAWVWYLYTPATKLISSKPPTAGVSAEPD